METPKYYRHFKGGLYKLLYIAKDSEDPSRELVVYQALKKNPFAPEVPCHRVIASDGSIGGFHGQRDGEMIQKKRDLLEEEKAL